MNSDQSYVTKTIFQHKKFQEALKYLIDNNVSNPIRYMYDAININQLFPQYACHDFKHPIIKKILEIFGAKVMHNFNDQIFVRILTIKCAEPCKNTGRYSLMHLGLVMGRNCDLIPPGLNDSEVLQLLFDKAINFCSANKEYTRDCLHGYMDDKLSTCLQAMFTGYGKGNLADFDCETLSMQAEPWKSTSSVFEYSSTMSSIGEFTTRATRTIVRSSTSSVFQFLSGSSESNSESGLIGIAGNSYFEANDENEQNFSVSTVVGVALSGVFIACSFSVMCRFLYKKYSKKPHTQVDFHSNEKLLGVMEHSV
ncbi:MAG: hypothetical protein HRK26_02250 [Rickettsiaceae bacterium H1]|nr:hypothetical protein [Rickettsiaceae bacterium H1]